MVLESSSLRICKLEKLKEGLRKFHKGLCNLFSSHDCIKSDMTGVVSTMHEEEECTQNFSRKNLKLRDHSENVNEDDPVAVPASTVRTLGFHKSCRPAESLVDSHVELRFMGFVKNSNKRYCTPSEYNHLHLNSVSQYYA
jgi:hypothetical protein